ncbi:hypothetical protein EW026_g2579 [Hermanssonia centrifuga]|uniref:Uncharacterized protein n=1 Tax=Hermanssonia centrifuga TaxID=98765 RepID=A0A4S4KSI8_9APHY|nr:hypothetical protein EW026_g2579 [Hermanssonia centrifuga]
MSSLLLALGDIIEKGEDGEDLYDESDEEVVTSPTFTRISGIFGQSVRRQNTDGGDDEGEVEAEDAQDRTALTKEDIGNDTEPTDRHSGTHELPGSLTHCAEFDHDQAFWPVGQLDHAAQREDSFDSGYADNWTGPSPFVLSPPKTPSTRRYSTLDLLSSPFGTPSRVISPKFAPSNWPSSPLLQHTQTDSSFQPNIEYLDELDSPSPDIPDRPRVDAPQGPDYESTIRRSSFPPLHDTASEEYVIKGFICVLSTYVWQRTSGSSSPAGLERLKFKPEQLPLATFYDYKFIKLWIFFVIIWHYPIIDYCCIIRNFTSSIISICIIGLFYVT